MRFDINSGFSSPAGRGSKTLNLSLHQLREPNTTLHTLQIVLNQNNFKEYLFYYFNKLFKLFELDIELRA